MFIYCGDKAMCMYPHAGQLVSKFVGSLSCISCIATPSPIHDRTLFELWYFSQFYYSPSGSRVITYKLQTGLVLLSRPVYECGICGH